MPSLACTRRVVLTTPFATHFDEVILAALFAALTAFGVFTSIPLYLVPVTLQSFFTLLAGAILGSCFGALSQTMYLLLGCVGTPVFAGGKRDLKYCLDPQAVICWFVAGAFVEGKFIEVKRDPSFGWILISMLFGTLTIYTFGVIQLSI